jgi:hypothetical protein
LPLFRVIQDQDFLSDQYLREEVEYGWGEVFNSPECWFHVPALMVDFNYFQAAVFEGRWEAFDRVSDAPMTGQK